MALGHKTGGRTKGTPNKTTAELKDMILQALDKAGGEEYLMKQADLNPASFLALLGRILPRDINANVNFNDELARRLQEARERISR